MLTRPMLVVLVLVVLVLAAMTNCAEQRLSAESDRDQNEVQWFQRQPLQMEQPLAASHVAILAGFGVNLPLTPP
jgi:hypothetical protein